MKAITLASTKDMTREEWLGIRRQGIGGSDAAAIMGANPYHSPLAVYFDKIGAVAERETTEAMRQGSDLEGYVAERFTEETGLKVRRLNRMLCHPDAPWMLANIDRSVVGMEAGLECKTTSVNNKSDFDGGVVPETYLWQCAHYLAVTGWSTWYLAVLVLNKSFHVFRIDRNDAHITALMEREKAFWHEHVLARVPPLPSGSDEDDDLIRSVRESLDPSGDAVDLSDIQSALDILPMLKRDKEAAKQRYECARQQIKLALGGSAYGMANGWSVTYKEQNRADVDGARLKKDYPDLYAQYLKTSTYPVLRIKEVK